MQLPDWLRRPIFGTLVTLLIIITGLSGSVFSAEIRGAFPFNWNSSSTSYIAVCFWVLVVISSLLYLARESSISSTQEKAQNEIINHARELENLVRTLPPANFLAVFREFFGGANKLADACFDRTSIRAGVDVEKHVRMLLRIIATLAQKFDRDFPDIEYAANIMVYRPIETLSPAEKEMMRTILLFCEDTTSMDALRGVLHLQPELSTTANEKNALPDPSLNAFTLAIPKKAKGNKGYKVLPGAPLAFVTKETNGYSDTRSLADWCQKHADLAEGEVVDVIRNHFENSPIRSFISIPLLTGSSDSSGEPLEDPIGILNIHSNRKGMLERDEGRSHFVNVIHPFTLLLARFLTALTENKK